MPRFFVYWFSLYAFRMSVSFFITSRLYEPPNLKTIFIVSNPAFASYMNIIHSVTHTLSPPHSHVLFAYIRRYHHFCSYVLRSFTPVVTLQLNRFLSSKLFCARTGKTCALDIYMCVWFCTLINLFVARHAIRQLWLRKYNDGLSFFCDLGEWGVGEGGRDSTWI
jgi:hypothetical protein